jgi:hypothetical protein
METFKGTKGKWVKNGKNGIHTEKGICVALSFTEEREANALLISKAPEMLEMLEIIVNADFNDGSWNYQACMDKARQLIKEATEL